MPMLQPDQMHYVIRLVNEPLLVDIGTWVFFTMHDSNCFIIIKYASLQVPMLFAPSCHCV